MQRGSTSVPSNPQSPSSSNPPSSKRQKVSHNDAPSTPTNPLTPQIPSDPEEARIQAAIARVAAERGETQWSFAEADPAVAMSISRDATNGNAGHAEDEDDDDDVHSRSVQITPQHTGLKVIQASWSDIDGRQGEKIGRRTYGPKTRKRPRDEADPTDSTSSTSSSSSSSSSVSRKGEEADDVETPNGHGSTVSALIASAKQLSKAERKAARKAEKATKRAKSVEKEVRKKVKLSRLTSISGTAGVGGGGGPGSKDRDRDVECFVCGERGHRKAECPRRRERKNGRKGKSGVVEGLGGLEY